MEGLWDSERVWGIVSESGSRECLGGKVGIGRQTGRGQEEGPLECGEVEGTAGEGKVKGRRGVKGSLGGVGSGRGRRVRVKSPRRRL